jgi:DMSO/TMAO reductase YedYZ molybdopterin-dependent catalytic subunit
MSQNKRDVSRRAFLGQLLGGAAATWAAGYLSPDTLWGQTSKQEPQGNLGLITRVTRPFDAETRVQEFASYLTPNDRFFVRSHFGPPQPEQIDENVWRLHVKGLVDRPLELTLKDLEKFDRVSLTAVVQCSGNGRAFHRPRAPGVQWERGAVGNAKWTGVRLRDVLIRAGAQPSARHLQMLGADRPVSTMTPLFLRSIPIEKAMHPDTLLATHMNGEPLPLLHGAPLRLITPGWMGEACVKWLTDLTLQEEEAKGFYMETAYRYPDPPVEPGTALNPRDMKPVEAMIVKSLIVSPVSGAALKLGPVTVEGVAWTGESKVIKVEVSIDHGQTWANARLVGEDGPYGWRQWQFIWNPRQPGVLTILARATDGHGLTQPMASQWNPGGFLWNGVDRIQVEVKDA